MLHHLHICVMCMAAACVCWGLALAWQADKTQEQCNVYPWLVYLPGSFLVHLTNIKAYRLSIFLRSDGRPKPFSHGYQCRGQVCGDRLLVLGRALRYGSNRLGLPEKYAGLQNSIRYIAI